MIQLPWADQIWMQDHIISENPWSDQISLMNCLPGSDQDQIIIENAYSYKNIFGDQANLVK